jgi:hypothetical protein
VRLNVARKDGTTLRASLEQVLRSAGRLLPSDKRAEIEAELNGDCAPQPLLYLWEYFWELRDGLTPEEHLTHTEIGWWMQNMATVLDPWEVAVLRYLDRAFMHAFGSIRTEETK